MSFMRTCLFLALFISFNVLVMNAQSGLIITGVMDGPLPGGTPKVVECQAINSIPDLSLYGIGVATNGDGSTDIGFTFPDTSLEKGSFIYLTTESVNFATFFGFQPTFITSVVNINGDDAIQLFFNESIVDVYGQIDLDGTGQAWEYLDGWAYRKSGSAPNGGQFVEADWTFSGPNALDNSPTNATAATPFPTASFAQINVDGSLDASGFYGAPLAVQNTPSSFGDNQDPDSLLASGSELDAVYAAVDGGFLFLFWAGNLESNFNKFDIFIDSEPGGQNRLLEGNPSIDVNREALKVMGDTLGQGIGLTFEDDFAGDYYYRITGGIEIDNDTVNNVSDTSYNIIANFAPLDTNVANGSFLGGGEGSPHVLNNGGLLAINNSNTAGVTSSVVGDPASVTTGIEFSIPLEEIGNPQGLIKITAFINNGFHTLISNMVLEGTGTVANLGNPRFVDFGEVPGTQYVSVCILEGSTIATDSGTTEVSFCSNDTANSIVNFVTEEETDVPLVYLVTDSANVIQAIVDGDSFDFSTLSVASARVWGLSFIGNLLAQVGDTASSVALSDTCFALSNNFITVNNELIDGGTVSTADGGSTISVDSVVIEFDSTGVIGENFIYVVTDSNNVILDVLDADTSSFQGFALESVRLWGLAFSGNLLAQVGDTASSVALSDGCFDLSDGFVTVFLIPADILGGTVLTESGEDTVFTCPGDGIPDIVRVDSFNVIAPNYAYVITDDQNVILGLPEADSADFDDAGVGICRIWGLAFSGTVTAQIGDTASTIALSDGEFALSSNFITVIRDSVSGGTVSTAAGDSIASVCIDDEDDFVSFASEGATGENFAYVITDEDNVILAISDSSAVNFNEAGPGICRVWGLGFNGNLLAAPNDTATTVELADNCFALSENFVTIVRDTVDGGELSTPSGDTEFSICAGDGTDDIIVVSTSSTSILPYIYVITDTNNVVITTADTDSINFDEAGPGVCRIWGLSYGGDLLAQPGDTASAIDLASVCFELSSNFITVDRGELDGGSVLTSTDLTEVAVCLDGNPDSITFVTTSLDTAFTFVVTDAESIILAVPEGNVVDFEPAGVGTCLVYGVSYAGDFTGAPGDTVGVSALASDCFSISSEFVTVYRDTVEGGTVALPNEDTEITLCGNDTISDIISFITTSESLVFYQYLVTDENNIILNVSDSDSIDFTNVVPGTFRVWGLSYTGELIAQVGQDASAGLLSDDCFELSDNFISVIVDTLSGGTVSLEDGSTDIGICAGDSFADSLTFATTSTSTLSYAYVITDDANQILALPEGNVADLEGAGAGVCRIWGLSFNGNIIAQIGDNAATTALTDDCFELSDNFITVTRDTGTTGICTVNLLEDLGISYFQVYPNPTDNELQVTFSSVRPNSNISTIEVYDARGRLAVKENMATAVFGDNTFKVDVASLEAGLYLLVLNNGDRIVSKRFIKE